MRDGFEDLSSEIPESSRQCFKFPPLIKFWLIDSNAWFGVGPGLFDPDEIFLFEEIEFEV